MAYFDKVRSIDAVQNGPVQICEETDRIYSGTIGKIIVKDAEWNRQICVERYGSNSAVVWNPWIDKSQRMNDFPDDGYHSMVCVEASNAGSDIVVVPPGGSHRLTTRISTI